MPPPARGPPVTHTSDRPTARRRVAHSRPPPPWERTPANCLCQAPMSSDVPVTDGAGQDGTGRDRRTGSGQRPRVTRDG